MTQPIRRAAVVGAGVMGSAIAAHLANAGVPTILLDIVPPDLAEAERSQRSARNRFSQGGLKLYHLRRVMGPKGEEGCRLVFRYGVPKGFTGARDVDSYKAILIQLYQCCAIMNTIKQI